ncbi:hypothetical protein [Bacillus tuaregi]|uniref:hypothetical protein n=1 Tax=Bacillus tuaregi TaxID=1816695 RepID=UPI0008F88FBD|nr:hypothetical protein [Bacillus tuaregi]
MNFEEALTQFTNNRVEDILVNTNNKTLQEVFYSLENSLEELDINPHKCEQLKLVIFQLIDSQNHLVYRQGLADAIVFLSSIGETKNKLGIEE